MKSPAWLKERFKSLAYKMFINEIDFHRLFDGILKVVFNVLVEFYTVNRRIFRQRMIRCTCISTRHNSAFLTGVCDAVYFRLCMDLMHITPPVTAEGFGGSHHPRYAEWVHIKLRDTAEGLITRSTEVGQMKEVLYGSVKNQFVFQRDEPFSGLVL